MKKKKLKKLIKKLIKKELKNLELKKAKQRFENKVKRTLETISNIKKEQL